MAFIKIQWLFFFFLSKDLTTKVSASEVEEKIVECLASACLLKGSLQGLGMGAAGWEQLGKAEEEVTTGRLLQKSRETTCGPVRSRGKCMRECWKC